MAIKTIVTICNLGRFYSKSKAHRQDYFLDGVSCPGGHRPDSITLTGETVILEPGSESEKFRMSHLLPDPSPISLANNPTTRVL